MAAFGVLGLFRYATGWLGVLAGLSFTNEESADHVVPLLFPLSMISNSFVPTDGMPGRLRVLAGWNPVSAVTAACRELWGNPAGHRAGVALPLQHPVASSLVWSVLSPGRRRPARRPASWHRRRPGLRFRGHPIRSFR